MVVIMQLIGFAATGALIGEAYRSVHGGHSINKYFIVNTLAGGFLSFLLAWGFYMYSGNKGIASIIAGVLSFQDEKKISKLAHNTVLYWLKGGYDNERDEED